MKIALSLLSMALQTLAGAPAGDPPGDAGRPPAIQAANESGPPKSTYEEAAYAAALSLSVQTCLGPAWGCCIYYVDADGKPGRGARR